MCLLPALKRGADKRPESGWGAEGPRLEPGRAGGLYKAVRLRAGRSPGSPGLYESPHGSAKSFTLGWFAGAPLHPSGLIPPSPPPRGSFGAKAALGPSGGGPDRELTPPTEFTAPFLSQVWFQNRRSKERRMKQLSALGARRHAFFRSPRRMRPLGGRLDESEMLGSTPYTYYGGKGPPGTRCPTPRLALFLRLRAQGRIPSLSATEVPLSLFYSRRTITDTP